MKEPSAHTEDAPWSSVESEAPAGGLLEPLLGMLSDAIVLVDQAFGLLGFNASARSFLELTSSSLGSPLCKHMELCAEDGRLLTEGECLQPAQCVGVRKAGTAAAWRWVRWGVRRYEAAGRARFIVTLTELTELRQVRAERARRHQEYSALAQSTATSVLRLDLQRRFTFVSKTVVRPDLRPEDMLGKSYRDGGFPPALVSIWDRALAQAEATLRPAPLEFEFASASGPRVLEGQVVPELDEKGALTSFLVTSSDVTDRKQIEAILRFSKYTLDHSAESIFWADQEGRVVYANRAAFDELGYDCHELLSMRVSDIDPNYPQEAWPAHWKQLQTGEVLQFETQHRSKDGRLIPVEVVVSLVEHGGRAVACGMARQIFQRKEEEARRDAVLESERTARERAEEANRTKELFLAMVSHELRTPLAALLLRTQRLRKDGSVSKQLDQALAKIEASAWTQKQLIDDLLDVSAMLTGKLALEERSLELEAVLEGALEVIRPAAEKKGVALAVQPSNASAQLNGDAARLQQVLVNLLGNAIKFTPSGGQVSVRLWKESGDGGGKAFIEVRDTGKGISPRFLPYLFDRFEQQESGSTRSHGGLGLGLAISRALVELHGGLLRAHSDGEGRGATFTVELPLRGRTLTLLDDRVGG